MWCTPIMRRDVLLMVMLALATFWVVRISPVLRSTVYTRSDPSGSLLVAQTIIQDGTVKVDVCEAADPRRPFHWQFAQHNGHCYYQFPLGTSLLATPFVAIANLWGMDMFCHEQESILQGWLAPLTVSVISLLIYSLSRFRFGSYRSTIFAVLFVFGTTLASSCGAALWSFNCELIFMMIALHCLLSISDGHGSRTLCPLLLGGALFFAYLSRPSALVFIAGCGGVLFFKNLSAVWKTLATLCVLFLAFIMFSIHEFGLLVPPYYQLTRLGGAATFWTALLGNTVSPSRGLFVFSPFLLLLLIFSLIHFRWNILNLFAYGWIVLNLVAVSHFPHWWGGGSFGPRLLTDVVPAFLLLGLLTAPPLTKHRGRVFWGLLLLLGGLSVGIHSVQGLYNLAPWSWQREPDIDKYPEYIFDWRCPQFLATWSSLERRMQRHNTAVEREQRSLIDDEVSR